MSAAALAVMHQEGPRGEDSKDQSGYYCSIVRDCKWTPVFMFGPPDSQTDVPSSGLVDGTLTSFSHGMCVWGYEYLHNGFADCNGTETTLTKATSGFGTATVTRTVTGVKPDGTPHRPWMTCDWFPHFSVEARVYEADADCSATGLMKGDTTLMNVHVTAGGGASADGHAHSVPLTATFSVGGQELQVPLASGSPDANAAAPQAGGHDEQAISSDTAFFISQSNMKAHCNGESWVDMENECEGWLWNSLPELDLHGCCKDCDAYAYCTYGWTQ